MNVEYRLNIPKKGDGPCHLFIITPLSLIGGLPIIIQGGVNTEYKEAKRLFTFSCIKEAQNFAEHFKSIEKSTFVIQEVTSWATF